MPRAEYTIRILVVFVVFTALFGGISRWLYHLQIERHDELHAKAKNVYTATETAMGRRGRILDFHGNVLAGVEECVDVLLEPKRIDPKERAAMVQLIIEVCGAEPATIKRRLASKQVEIVVKREISLAKKAKLAELKIPGLRFEDSYRRFYPKGSLASHCLGFTNAKGGAYGIDLVYDKYLRPSKGTFKYERNRRGGVLSDSIQALKQPMNGKDVYLTLSEPLQDITETELAKLDREFTPRYAYAIMADPKTGRILALAQTPSFDPNDRRYMTPDSWRNHAVSDVYHPGSTMKPIAICGAIDFGVTHIDEEFYCEKGLWYYAGRPLRDTHAYEYLKLWEIIQHSSNIGTAKCCLKLQDAKLYQTFRRFGFKARTGIELSEESRGLLPAPSGWDSLSITRFPIGQGLAVTPLQMVQAYCALANKGAMMKLHLVDKVVESKSGNAVFKTEPQMVRQSARAPAVADTVMAMKTVVTREGTAGKAQVPGYHVAGKTGTSQKWFNNTYDNGKYVASFIGFVPADNPAFVLLIVADEPHKKHYGGTVCGPTFSNISKRSLRFLNIPPDFIAETRR